MAVVKQNIVTEGLSGALGNKIVFRKRGSKTIVSVRPERRDIQSEKQVQQQRKFLKAVQYAKAQMQDPASKEEYDLLAKRKEFMSAFTAAVTDYLKAPEIQGIETDTYKGEVGNEILVRVADDFKIAILRVSILRTDGTTLETGLATMLGGLEWKYTATAANPLLAGSKIKCVASDKPGNQSLLEKIL